MKLIYLVTEDWYFLSHRLPMARAAREAGFEVSVACRCTEAGAARIAAEGFGVHKLSWRRSDHTPWGALFAILKIARLYRKERPAIVHHVAMKPVVLGGIAAMLASVPCMVNAVAGLGHLFIARTLKARLLRGPVRLAMRVICARCGSMLLLQNPDDRDALVSLGVVSRNKTVLIRGSGIEVSRYQALPEPQGPMTMAYVGRMLANKGVDVLGMAQQTLWRQGERIELLLAGPVDTENPTAIPEEQLRAWSALPGITWLGAVSDVREVWKRAHVALLMSKGGEGVPKCLLEAAACGRAIIASDVPGCREIGVSGENAILVPVGDAEALAQAMLRLARDPGLRQKFGAASRRLAEGDFSEQNVMEKIVRVYESVMKERLETC